MAIVYDDVTITLSTLGAGAAISANSKIDASRLNGFRVMKTEYWIDYSGKTGGQGPIMIGFSAYEGSANVEAAIEADPQSSVDNDANAIAKVPIWPLEMLPAPQNEATDDNFGVKGTFNPRWSTPEGQAANWWAYNMSGSALTTGCVVRIFAKHFGVWLRD